MNESVEQTWGIRFNPEPAYSHGRSVEHLSGCPDWLNSYQIRTWQEQGLIVWNNLDKKIERLNGSATLNLLDQLLSRENWKTEGISTAHLHPEAGEELINLIQMNKEAFTKMADIEKRQCDQAMKQIWEWLLDLHHKKEQDEINFTERNFNWQCTGASRWACQHQTAKGRVCLLENKWFWCVCAERTGLPQKFEKSLKLQEVIEWAEKEIVDLANQPEPEIQPRRPSRQQIEIEQVRISEKLRNGPFWIDPTVFEAKRPTYKIYIDLDAEPATCKTYKSFCTDSTYRLDEHYLSSSKMSAALNLDFDHFGFERILGENSGWYWITSLTTYYQEAAAAEQAQKVWDHSQILQQFKAGKIKRARYGYLEVETGYAIFLGACEKPEYSWEQPESRKKYLETEALRESVCYALDVNDYRAFLGLSVKDASDEQLLEGMHTIRARSKYLPEEIRRESKIWLAQHEPLGRL
ncbi:MAG: hypothetical protein EHM81_03185 [Chloroflexi bacterium]|nr:MAG: hypothetical protein EHM81_03185 [Chloroflexota bacterium]